MTNCCCGSSFCFFMVYLSISIRCFSFYVTFPLLCPEQRLKYGEICGYIKTFCFLKYGSKSRYQSLTRKILRHIGLDISV